MHFLLGGGNVKIESSLGFPNREVEEGFIKFLLPFYANTNAVESEFEI